jgi:N-acetylmuramoyl-L-alanine amidase
VKNRRGKWRLAAAFLFLAAAALPAQYVEMDKVLATWQAGLQWDPLTETGTIDRAGRRLTFTLGSPWIMADYRSLIRTTGIIRRDGALLFPEDTVRAVSAYLTQPPERGVAPRVAVLLIDAGHGGQDPGAIGYLDRDGERVKVQEKDVVLKVALDLHRRLSRAYPDKQILLTRRDDNYLKLEERTQLANEIVLGEHEAIIFISIHANASFNKKARGYEVWYLPPDYRRDLLNPASLEEENQEIVPILNALLEEEYTIESIRLAREIIAGFRDSVGAETESRGIKEESWFVVRNAKMPSVLVELGFVTHPEEVALLARGDYLQKLSEGIYTGIRNFVSIFESSKGFTE